MSLFFEKGIEDWVANEVYRCATCSMLVHENDLIIKEEVTVHDCRIIVRSDDEEVQECGPVVSNGIRRIYTTGYVGELMLGEFFVNEYEVGRDYGGPEEGGWWYDVGKFKKCRGIYTLEEQALDRKRVLIPLMERQNKDKHRPDSVLCHNDWSDTYIELHEGRSFPKERPHYE